MKRTAHIILQTCNNLTIVIFSSINSGFMQEDPLCQGNFLPDWKSGLTINYIYNFYQELFWAILELNLTRGGIKWTSIPFNSTQNISIFKLYSFSIFPPPFSPPTCVFDFLAILELDFWWSWTCQVVLTANIAQPPTNSWPVHPHLSCLIPLLPYTHFTSWESPISSFQPLQHPFQVDDIPWS